jgi:hypothetical protein
MRKRPSADRLAVKKSPRAEIDYTAERTAWLVECGLVREYVKTNQPTW